MINAHEIKNDAARIAVYSFLLPLAVIALLCLFFINGVLQCAIGAVRGFCDGFSDGNDLIEVRFWRGVWKGIRGI